MRKIAAAKFKEQCLSLLDSVDEGGLVITKRGVPVARLLPVRAGGASLIGLLAGSLRSKGDLFSTGVRWDAEP